MDCEFSESFVMSGSSQVLFYVAPHAYIAYMFLFGFSFILPKVNLYLLQQESICNSGSALPDAENHIIFQGSKMSIYRKKYH